MQILACIHSIMEYTLIIILTLGVIGFPDFLPFLLSLLPPFIKLSFRDKLPAEIHACFPSPRHQVKRPTWKYVSMFSTSSGVRLPYMFVYTNRTHAVNNSNCVLVHRRLQSCVGNRKDGQLWGFESVWRGTSVTAPVNTEWWTRRFKWGFLIQQLVTNADPPCV